MRKTRFKSQESFDAFVHEMVKPCGYGGEITYPAKTLHPGYMQLQKSTMPEPSCLPWRWMRTEIKSSLTMYSYSAWS